VGGGLRESRSVLRVASVCLLLSAGAFVAGATAAAPKLSATVTSPSPTSRLVHIVNHDRVAYRNFVVVANRSAKPTITAASKPCVVARDGGFTGITFIWQYRAECRMRLAPGHSFDIRLTTSRVSVRIAGVYVVVNGTRMQIK
jgi:hypothetical protein